MIRKQLAQAISETLNYFFNWNEYTVSQLFLSGLVVILFCKTMFFALVNFAVYAGTVVKETIQRFKDESQEDGHAIFGIAFRHRHSQQ